MKDDSHHTPDSFFYLEKIVGKFTKLQRENINLLMELEEVKQRLKEERLLAQIESKVYSGIKKFFK